MRVGNLKISFLLLNQNCCGYSKEGSRLNGTFEHPKPASTCIHKSSVVGGQDETVWTQIRPDRTSGLIWIQTFDILMFLKDFFDKNLILKKNSRR